MKIAVVGTGQIGSSWVILFLAKGHRVIVSDPAPQAEQKLRKFIDAEWPQMQQIGLAEKADPNNFEFVEDITLHLQDVDFVQENAPERADFKLHLIANIDAHLPKTAIIASSSSGIPASQFINECKVDPSRVLIGHPFNPPHLIPLVEVVPHPGTSQTSIDQAIAFYKSLGKAPVLIEKETPGFVANRLQAAVLTEAYSLVSRGIASPEDVDTAMKTGPGLRWAVMGPFESSTLGGGAGENPFSHFLHHLGPAIQSWKSDMDRNSFEFKDEDVQKLEEEVGKSDRYADVGSLRRTTGSELLNLLKMKVEA